MKNSIVLAKEWQCFSNLAEAIMRMISYPSTKVDGNEMLDDFC